MIDSPIKRKSVYQFLPVRVLPVPAGQSSLQARRVLVGLYAGPVEIPPVETTPGIGWFPQLVLAPWGSLE